MSDDRIANYRNILRNEDINTLKSFYYLPSTVLEKILVEGGMKIGPKMWLLEKHEAYCNAKAVGNAT